MIATATSIFTTTASHIGIQICRDAIWSDDRCNWLTLTHERDSGNTYMRALYNEFYLGTAGVAYFLAALYRVNADPLFKKTALGAMRQSLSQLEQTDSENRMGFYRGWSGIAFTAFYVAEHLHAPEMKKAALQLLKKINQLDPKDLKLDIVEGIASGLPALIRMYRQHPSAPLKKQLYALGDYLIAKAHKTDEGWSWETIKDAKHLTGLAHGAAGFQYALLELYHLDGKEKYQQAAQQAYKFECTHFNEQEQNWPDYRANGQQLPADHKYPCVNAWCHGAPGIGLARVRAYEITSEAHWKTDAQIAIASTQKSTHVSQQHKLSLSLCHGVFGNADVYINAALAFQDDSLMEQAKRLGREAIEQYIKPGIPMDNGVGTRHQIPDFMLGLSGMGYYFLRLAEPELFESMLLVKGE